jgi:hypothetical protein
MSSSSGVPLPPATLNLLVRQPEESDWAGWSRETLQQKQWAAYLGQFPPHLKPRDGVDHNVIVNRCQPIVSSGVDFLLGEDLGFEVEQDDRSTDDEATDYLNAVLDAQPLGKLPLLTALEINGGVFGHQYAALVPDDPDTAPYPSIAVINPQQVQVETESGDYRKAVAFQFTWTEDRPSGAGGDASGQILRRKLWVREGSSGGWTIYEQERSSAAPPATFGAQLYQAGAAPPISSLDGWVDLADPLPWRYPWCPLHDGPNLVAPNQYEGRADLTPDVIHLNDVLNFHVSNLNRIVYFHGHPKVFGTGARARDLEVGVDESVWLPNANAKVYQLEITGDLVAARALVDEIRESMDELSHVPAVAVGRLSNLPGVPSGVALRVAYRPLISQTLHKRQLREAGIYTKLAQHILELGGYGADRRVHLHWAEMLPTDSLQEAQTAILWQQIGASRDTLLQRGGFDPAAEAEKKAEEDAADAEAQARSFAASGLPALADQQQQQPGTNQQQQPGNGQMMTPQQQPQQQPQQLQQQANRNNNGRNAQ